jgi:U3 small nucleolar RNA-associated protein 20
MVPVIGNSLYATNVAILIPAARCAANLAKCPLKSLNKSLPVYITQIIDLLRQAGNTESELAQALLKSLATILRDGPAVQVKEKDLVFLLEIVTPELEEPERQASAFSMLRAIVARKFVVPEIYDTMEKVSEILVTSQSSQVQELSRGVLLQFLLDYPQGKGRLRNQMTFLAQNLSYIHESGRISVMELLGAIISKFQETLIGEYGDLMFVALVMVIANDDSAKCREMAAGLIKSLFKRLDEPHREVLMSHLHVWASQEERPQLSRVSSQIYGYVVEVLQDDSKIYVDIILKNLNTTLMRSVQSMEDIAADYADSERMDVDADWKTPYNALGALTKVCRTFPQTLAGNQCQQIEWQSVVEHLLFPHSWVRLSACRLLGMLFTSIPLQDTTEQASTLTRSLPKISMQGVALKLTSQLKSEHLDESLGLQVVKNLFYVGKHFYLDTDSQENDQASINLNDGANEGAASQDRSLPWLFSNLSYQIKSAHIARRNRQSSFVRTCLIL